MIYGSVCSGIEAASLAWEPLGWNPAWFAEIEPFPSAVLAHHWPHVTNLGDMTKIATAVLKGDVVAPDILVGGTPCQAFSVAGAREGLADDRGFLTIKYVELANAIDQKRAAAGAVPCITVWENVPGVLSSKDNAFGAFLGFLAGEDCELVPPGKKWENAGCVLGPQRAIAWRILDAQYFGVAQRRRRVFVVASAREGFDPAKVLLEREGVRRDSAPSREAGKNSASTAGAGFKVGSHWDGDGYAHPTLSQSHNTGGIGASNQELFSQRGSGLVMAFGQNNTSGPVHVSHALNACAGPHGRLDFESETFLVQSVHGTQDPDTNVELAHTLGRNQGQENAVFSGVMAVRRLTPVECERIQGFPEHKKMNEISVINDGDSDGICSEHPKKSVRVGTKNPKLLKYALNVEGEKLLQNAKRAAKSSSVSLGESSEPVVAHVLIDLERQHLQLRSAEKSILSVSIAGKQSESLLPIPPEDFARVAALMTQEAVKITRTGKAESQDCGTSFSIQRHGRMLSVLSGREIGELASDAALFTSLVSEHLKFITSPVGRNSLTSEQMFAISSCFVAAAINGFIPEEMRNASSFDLRVTVNHGHTNIPVNGKPAADGHRYKAIGNSMAVPCMAFIGQRIALHLSEIDLPAVDEEAA